MTPPQSCERGWAAEAGRGGGEVGDEEAADRLGSARRGAAAGGGDGGAELVGRVVEAALAGR